MGIGLSGNLRDFGIADVFQLIGQQRKTGLLELTNAKVRVQLIFEDGAVVFASSASGRSGDGDPLAEMMVRCGLLTRERAEQAQARCRSSAQTIPAYVVEQGWIDAEEVRRVEDLLTRDTIFEVLRWESGSFDFRAQGVEHDRDRGSLLGAEQILMDGLRMIDEWRSFAHHVPSESTVFQRVGRFETYAERKAGMPREQLERARKLFSLVDGRLSVRRAVDLSRLGSFDGTRMLAEFVEEGLIKPLHPEGVRTLRKQERSQGAQRRGLGIGGIASVAVGSVLPLVLLLVAAWLAQSPATPEVPGPGVEARALERLREAYATRRIRNAIDAYRLTEGHWPDVFRDLPTEGYLDRAALAAPEGRPYYSANRDDGVVFLAPEH